MASPIHATDDSATFLETDVISGNLLSNDTSDNGHLFLRAFDGETVGAKSGNSQITEIHGDYGTFFVKPDGSYTYVLSDAAKIGFANGESYQEKVSYKISDGSGHTDVGLFTLNIQGVTQVKPIAVDDVYSFTEGHAIGGNVLDNDIAGDNGKMFLRQFLTTKVDGNPSATTDVAGTYGTFHVKSNGEFTYELTHDIAAGDHVTEVLRYYKISDGDGHTDTAKVTLNITGTDALPHIA
ncbi:MULTISPECIES: Ig-like domain-containing protein [unclassified Rhizobium]|uniref:Ig-like domain-containing protein n=1 Tax=unclassified Rhizobium TaxID=2613769 RepID=UPI001A98BEE9|nr:MULTISPECIES: Ig-like domain-containing protein [unclassified Rhizobium]MBX5156480.1 Ig-like domain-containing protein [Rhizobium sp. NZLR8]MBX5162606.1 Ig-like domain-containing protein [Rhizobium sp. NZLR4b]MBX5172434.1 Ig-like domain-containing protein [Rhizobium sp. NZLR1b]MBX5182198.1 Ig-like domain-containing protein [Rhizobium sp. NZLR5]MBX5187458.1 Ig-like domain-containing protein [Rhizobium sp. NZLR3b]